MIESPAFYGLLLALEAAGLQALALQTDAQTGIDPDVLQQALLLWPVKACVLIANYSNPLGSLMPDEHKKRVVALLDARNIPLIEDDTYGDLGFAGQRPASCLALDLRLGWVIAPRHTARLEYLKFISNISTAALPQLAVAKLIQSGRYERHLLQVRGQYQAALQRISSSIGRLFPTGTSWHCSGISQLYPFKLRCGAGCAAGAGSAEADKVVLAAVSFSPCLSRLKE